MTADYDIVIIGAGIQGAGVAQAAAASGYKTLVIEKNQQAGLGTSSKSSKLIHGGLRYLENGQFSLVKECLNERASLIKNAPDLVKLIPFYIPVTINSSRPFWKIWLGLILYSIFSLKPFHHIRKKMWTKLDDLKTSNITHIFKYYDAQTNDTQLTQAIALSAQQHGAKFLYNTEFFKSIKSNNIHTLSYKKNNSIRQVTSHSIVNCSGPWVNLVQQKIEPKLTLPEIDLIAGTHIIINRPTHAGAYYLEADDKRAVFVIPWEKNKTLIGTTERKFTGNPDMIHPTNEEINYLIRTYNDNFTKNISEKNIVTSFAGLRVLPACNTSSFERSRESIIYQDTIHPEIISLIGGKLTAYRASSEQIMQRLVNALPKKKKLIDTRFLAIPSNN